MQSGRLSERFFACLLIRSLLTSASDPLVTTPFGPVLGTKLEGASQFLGVPFAEPPVGTARFSQPRDWLRNYTTTPLVARTPAAACPQFPGQLLNASDMSEDCLLLNIWAPTQAYNAPVLVWLHGGGFNQGSGNGYNGTELALRFGVVVVTINYRLGPLGFLALPEFQSEAGIAGNFGILDIVSSLRWLQKCVTSFGGDKGRVTAFGQSAGAALVQSLTHTPVAAGLFHSAISESRGTWHVPLSWAYEHGRVVVRRAGCEGAASVLQCLREVPVQRLLDAGGNPGESNHFTDCLTVGNCSFFPPAADGKVIVGDPLCEQLRGDPPPVPVPLLAGTTTNDGNLMTIDYFDELPAEQYASLMNSSLFTRAHLGGPGAAAAALPRLLKEYPPDPNGDATENAERLGRFYTDFEFRCPTRLALRAQAAAGQPALSYRFAYNVSWRSACDLTWPQEYGVPHTAELSFVFNDVVYPFGPPTVLCRFRPEEDELARRIGRLWTSFAAGTLRSTDWPLYLPNLTTVVLDMVQSGEPFETEIGSRGDPCDVWEDLWTEHTCGSPSQIVV